MADITVIVCKPAHEVESRIARRIQATPADGLRMLGDRLREDHGDHVTVEPVCLADPRDGHAYIIAHGLSHPKGRVLFMDDVAKNKREAYE